jgi:serine/threonine protein kinase
MLNLGAFLTGVLQLHTEAGGSAVPDAFGPFRVLHQIGAGVLGPVFRAYDAEGERLVAVKLFRLDLPPDRVHQLVDAFERLIESEPTHPSLAVPIATGIVGVSAYLAVEYVSAESLDLAVREYGPAPPLDAVRVTTQLAAALDFAAAVAAVHGSMHPRDILLSASETRITGIGVAQALERVGVAVPIRRPYTAPERIAGRAWDRRSDIFSLAALSHEMLWGRRIAGTGSHVAESMTELSGARLLALKDAFARALADDPADRFGTALDFADALSQAFEGAEAIHDSGIAIETFDPEPILPLEPLERLTAQTQEAVAEPTPRADPHSPSTLPPTVAAEEMTVSAPNQPVQGEPSDRAADLELVAAERKRFEEVETPPSIVPVVPEASPEPLTSNLSTATTKPVERRTELLADFGKPLEAGTSSRARSIAGPVAAALVTGLALGFAGGYAVSMRDHATTSSQEAAQTQPAASSSSSAVVGRKATDVTVADPPKPAPSVPPRAAAPKAEAAAPAAAAGSKTERRSTPSASSRQTAPRAARAPERATTTPASGTAGRFVGALLVESRPEGAKVFLDGRLIGSTPLSMPGIPAGEHAIRLERDGYRRWSSSIRIVASEQNRVTASLER